MTITSGPTEIATGAATFVFSATDPTPPTSSGVASYQCRLDGAVVACTPPAATVTVRGLTIGPHVFSAAATDNAGNVGAAASFSFKVVYTFTLTQPLKGRATLGSSVPLTFMLTDTSGNIVNTLTPSVPLLELDSVFNGPAPASGCGAPSATGTKLNLYSPATGAKGNSRFRYASGYQFNWDTTTVRGTGAGCYTLLIYLSDGSAPKLTNVVQID
jgi:hypothetical protein